MRTINEILLDRGIRHAVYVTRLAGGVAKWVEEDMRELYDDLTEVVLEFGEIGALGFVEDEMWLLEDDEMRKLREKINEIEKITEDKVKDILEKLDKELKQIRMSETEYETNLLRKEWPIGKDFQRPTPEYIQKVMETEQIVGGKKLGKWFRDIPRETADRIDRTVRQGMLKGESIGKIVRRIRGTRMARFRDGKLYTTTRHAQTIARTAVMSVSNDARMAVHQRNADVIKGYNWVLTLDDRTCFECMDGEAGNPYPLNQPPMVPAHPNCRCVVTAITKSWQELGIDLDEMKPGERASMDGLQPASMTYPEWLAKQEPGVQLDVLGGPRFRAYKQGVNVTSFVSGGQVLTLKELQQKEPGLVDIRTVRKPKPDPIVTMLESGKIIRRESMAGQGGGTNESYKVYFKNGEKAIWKPVAGENIFARSTIRRSSYVDFPLAKREVMASRLDEALGWNLVPKTRMRTIEVGGVQKEGSIQHWYKNGVLGVDYTIHDWRRLNHEEMFKGLVFDDLICNTDRHNRNVMFDKTTRRPILIDNGFSFPFKRSEWRPDTWKAFGSAKNNEAGMYGADWSVQYRDIIPYDFKQKVADDLRKLDLNAIIQEFMMSQEEADLLIRRREMIIEGLEQDTYAWHFSK